MFDVLEKMGAHGSVGIARFGELAGPILALDMIENKESLHNVNLKFST